MGDSVRANLDAWHSDQKAAIGEGFAIYPEHNLHMLLYAASYHGQGAIATRAGKDYTKLTRHSFHEVLTLIRFGRFDEVFQITPATTARAGMVGTSPRVRASQAGQHRLRTTLPGAREEDGGHSKGRLPLAYRKDLLSIAAGILEGEMQRMDGDLSAAIKSFRRAADLQNGLQS